MNAKLKRYRLIGSPEIGVTVYCRECGMAPTYNVRFLDEANRWTTQHDQEYHQEETPDVVYIPGIHLRLYDPTAPGGERELLSMDSTALHYYAMTNPFVERFYPVCDYAGPVAVEITPAVLAYQVTLDA